MTHRTLLFLVLGTGWLVQPLLHPKADWVMYSIVALLHYYIAYTEHKYDE